MELGSNVRFKQSSKVITDLEGPSIRASNDSRLLLKPSDEPGYTKLGTEQKSASNFNALLKSSFGSTRGSLGHSVQSFEHDTMIFREEKNADLVAQLNLLRERSWSEQQYLRRQCEELEAINEKQRKELEQIGAQLQETKALSSTASKCPIHELSPAHVKAPSNAALLTSKSQAECERLREQIQVLEQDLIRVQSERQKEQDDLQELEQVINVFEAKMDTLKKENKDLKIQVMDYQNRQPNGEVPCGSDALIQVQNIVEKWSTYAGRLQMERHDHLLVSEHFRGWRTLSFKGNNQIIANDDEKSGLRQRLEGLLRDGKAAESTECRDITSPSDSDFMMILKLQLDAERCKVANLSDAMNEVRQRNSNLLESEREQCGRLAQRLMKADDTVSEQAHENVKLKKDLQALKALLEAANRSLECAPMSEGEQLRRIMSLEDNVSELNLECTTLHNKLSFLKESCIERSVNLNRRKCLVSAFETWNLYLASCRKTTCLQHQHRHFRSLTRKQTVFTQWAITACFVHKYVHNSKEDDAAQSKLACELLRDKPGENEFRASLNMKTQEKIPEAEGLKDRISIMSNYAKTLEDQNAALSNDLNQAKLEINRLTSQISKLEDFKPQIDKENLRNAEIQERLKLKQSKGELSEPEARVSLLREETIILSSKLDTAEMDKAYLLSGFAALKDLQDDLTCLCDELADATASTSLLEFSNGPVSFDPCSQITMIVLIVQRCREQLGVLREQRSNTESLFCKLLQICHILCCSELARVDSSNTTGTNATGSKDFKKCTLDVQDLRIITTIFQKVYSEASSPVCRTKSAHSLQPKLVQSDGEGTSGDLVTLLTEFLQRSQSWQEQDMTVQAQRSNTTDLISQGKRQKAMELQYQMEIQTKQQIISSLSAKLTLLQNDSSRLQSLADGDKTVQSYESSIRFLQDMVLNLISKLGKKVAHCEQLDRQLQELSKNLLSSASRQSRQLQEPVLGHVGRFLDKSTLQEGKEVDSDALESTISCSCDDLKRAREDHENLSKEYDSLKERWGHAVNATAVLTTQLEELSSIWRSGTIDMIEGKSRIQRADMELEELRVTVELHKNQINLLKAENSALMNEKHQRSEIILRAQDEIGCLKVAAEQRVAENKSLSAAVSRCENSNGQLSADLACLQQKLFETEKNLSLANLALEQSKNLSMIDRNTMQTRIRTMSDKEARFLSELPTVVKELGSAVEDMRSTCSSIDLITRAAFEQYQSVRDELIVKESTLALQEKERDRLMRELQECKDDNVRILDESRRLQTQSNEFSRAQKKSCQDLYTLEGKLERAEKENENIRATLCVVVTLDKLVDDVMLNLNHVATATKAATEGFEKQLVASLSRERLQCQKLMSTLQDQVELKSELSSMSSLKNSIEIELSYSKKEFNDFNKRFLGKLDELVEITCFLSDVIEELSNYVCEARREILLERETRGHLTSQLAETISKLDIMQVADSLSSCKLAELQNQVSTGTVKIASLQHQNQELIESLQQKETELLRLQTLVLELSSHKNELQDSALKTSQDTAANVAVLKSQYNHEYCIRIKLEEEKEYLHARINILKSELSSSGSVVERQQKSIECLQIELCFREHKVDELMETIHCRNETIEHLAQVCRISSVNTRKLQDSLKYQALQLDEMSTAKCLLERELNLVSDKCAHQKQTLDDQLSNYALEVDRLHSELTGAKDNCTQLSNQVQSLESEVAIFKGDVYRMKSKIEFAEASAHNLKTNTSYTAILVEEILAQLLYDENALKSKEVDAEFARREVLALKGEIETLQYTSECSETELSKAKKHTESLAMELADSVASNLELAEQINALDRERGHLQGEFEIKSSSLEEAHFEISRLSALIENLNRNLVEAGQLNSSLKESLASHQTFTKSLEDIVENLSLEIQQAKAHENQLHSEINDLKVITNDQLLCIDNERNEAKNTFSSLREELQQAKESAASFKSRCDSMSVRILKLEDECAKSREKLFEYDKILQVKGKEIARLHGSLAEAKSLADDAQERLQAWQDKEEMDRGRRINSDLKFDLHRGGHPTECLDDESSSQHVLVHSGHPDTCLGPGCICICEMELVNLGLHISLLHDALVSLSAICTARQHRHFMVEKLLVEWVLVIASCCHEVESLKTASELMLEGEGTQHAYPSRKVQNMAGRRSWALKRDAMERLINAVDQRKAANRAFVEMLMRCKQRHEKKGRSSKDMQRLDDELNRLREEGRIQTLELQRQIVEKSDLLLASERKFAQLLAWVQKEKSKIKSK